MAKVKYDVTNVEPGTDFDTPIPVAAYKMQISDATVGTSKASIERGDPQEMITVEYEIVEDGEFKGRKVWDYIVLNDISQWKVRQLIDALGSKLKGTLDTDAIIGSRVLVRV